MPSKYSPKHKALADHLKVKPEVVEETVYGTYEVGVGEYLVLNNDEIEKAMTNKTKFMIHRIK